MTNGMYPFCSALHSIQRAPSWKGLHTLVVKPPNVGKGYTIVLSESHHKVYMFMFVKSQRSIEKNHLKISLIQCLKEMKNKRLNGVQLRIVKKLGLTNRNGNTSHMHTHTHMLITILLKAKIQMNIGLTYFWKCFRWIGVEIVCMLISQLFLLYM